MAKLVHTNSERLPEHERAVLIVTGSTLAAEAFDRAAAHTLRAFLKTAMPGHDVVVCGDIWYLNQDDLRGRPTLSVGSPQVNALTAYLADRLPTAYAIDDVLMIQADVEFDEPVASCWGVTHEATARAVGEFRERYLKAFVKAAARV